MPAIEDKYKHIRVQMVRNFKFWAVFMVLQTLLIAIGIWQNNSLELQNISQFTIIVSIGIGLIAAQYLPAFFIEIAPFDYHNDNGRMFAYRVKLGLTLFLLIVVAAISSFYFIYAGIDKIIATLVLISLFKGYKLRPSANVWVDFRMRYRAGRTMPVRSR
ncbi:MAG: hypothetical protein DWQ05_10760 [Calditrichaeota bacterium]|nr:MAG: hypothetical protein DWQ05_10760 [Calditrichota bacterium]